MQIIFDYLSGRMLGQEFIQVARTDDAIPAWFQSLLPEGADVIDTPYIPYRWENGVNIYQSASSSHPFWKDVYIGQCLNVLNDRIDFYEYFHKTKDFDTAGDRLNAYAFLFSIAKKYYPELVYSDRFSREFGFFLDVCGEYTDGPEVEQYAQTIVFEVYYSDLIMTEKKRIAKQQIRDAFHIADKHYPRWIQGAEWPMGQKTPMKYIKRKRDGDRVVYTFQDVDTGEIKDVEQFY